MFYSTLPLVVALLQLGAQAAQFPAVVEQNRPDVADAFSHLKIESREGFRVPQAVPVGISSQVGAKTAQWSVEEGFSGDYALDGSVNSVHKRFIDDSTTFAVDSEVVFEDDASSNHGVARTGNRHCGNKPSGGHSGLHCGRPKEFVSQQTCQEQNKPKQNRRPEVVYVERDNCCDNRCNKPFPMNVRGDGPFIDNSDRQNTPVSIQEDDSSYECSNYELDIDSHDDSYKYAPKFAVTPVFITPTSADDCETSETRIPTPAPLPKCYQRL